MRRQDKGRFWSPDAASGKLRAPLSWNRYAYAVGDPVNRADPQGMDAVLIGSGRLDCTIFWSGSYDEDESLQYNIDWSVCCSDPGYGGGGGLVEGVGGGGDAADETSMEAGLALATKWLDAKDCWGLMLNDKISDKDKEYVTDGLSEASPKITTAGFNPPTATVNGTSASVSYQLGSQDGDNILLNGYVFPNPGNSIGSTSESVLKAFNTNYNSHLDATQLMAVTILHELSHYLGRPDDRNDATATKAFNMDILNKCNK